jgi:hypothetical protein
MPPPRRPAGTRSRSRSPEAGTSSVAAAAAAGSAQRKRSVSNKTPVPRSGQAAASASASGPAAPDADLATAPLVSSFSSAPAAAASGSGDYLEDFAAAVDLVRAALVTPSTVRAVLLGDGSNASQQVDANAAAVEVLARALDRMAVDELERQERLLSVAEHRPRQPSQPPPKGSVKAMFPVAAAIAPKAAAIAPKAAAAAGAAPLQAPRTPPQGPKAKPGGPPLTQPPLGTAASATPQWPSAPAQTWWSPGSWEDRTSSSTAWDSSKGTSASTPFTAKSPIAISDSRS